MTDIQITMRLAAEVLREERSRLKLTTGSRDLDALIDGVVQGQLYIFYSGEQSALDGLVHRVLVNCVLPVEKGGLSSKGLYFNTCNYHLGKTILDPSMIAMMAKCARLDPKAVFQNIYSISAFNEMQQVKAMDEAVDLLARVTDVKLVVIHNVTRFIETSHKPFEARRALKRAIRRIKRAAYEHDLAVVVSCGAGSGQSRQKPLGGTFLRHEANVVVYLKQLKRAFPTVKVTLVKHPYKRTPKSITLYRPTDGVDLTGSRNPSFDQQFQRLMEDLRRSIGFRASLPTLQHREAFDLLLEKSWCAEVTAISSSGIPCILDVLNLMASIHNKKRTVELKRRLLGLRRVHRARGRADGKSRMRAM